MPIAAGVLTPPWLEDEGAVSAGRIGRTGGGRDGEDVGLFWVILC